MTPNDIRTFIRQFVIDSFRGDKPLPNDVALIPSGIVDSTGFLEIVTFVEDTFGFKVGDEDITEANWGSIDRMVAYVERRLAAAP